MKEALIAIVRQKRISINVLFFIDALGEHQGSHIELVKIPRSLANGENSLTTRIKICLASRQVSVFPGALHSSPGFVIHEYTERDIEHYVSGHFECTFDSITLSENNRQTIRSLSNDVVERAEGVFIWVKLGC